ncbi:MAG: 50S ribosomal protein L22 [Candidatus Doudnabacteria bacterium]|nr:50S ribosomal protein L22 [Candidatus Doudnabacteria bacterium]
MAKQETPKNSAKGGFTSGGQEVKAFARFIHTSPQKLRLVADLIRRARVDVALEQLRFSPKTAALPMAKLLNSAIANAVHNHNFNKEDLVIKAVTVDGGPVMKRMFPRAQGQGFIIRKRMSHINIVLESRPKSKSKKSRSIFSRTADQTKAEARPIKNEVEEGKVENKNDTRRTAPKSEEKVKRQTNSLKRRLFNRKSGE